MSHSGYFIQGLLVRYSVQYEILGHCGDGNTVKTHRMEFSQKNASHRKKKKRVNELGAMWCTATMIK
jgi:hypothetical protein